jgi:hypothetical protein
MEIVFSFLPMSFQYNKKIGIFPEKNSPVAMNFVTIQFLQTNEKTHPRSPSL